MSETVNKDVVRRFNAEVIQAGNREVFEELMAPDFVNRSAPANVPNGAEGMWNTFANVLHPALSDLTVTIHDQISEGDRVTTRKTIRGVHTGALMGISPTGKSVSIDVIDIMRVRSGQYVEHWGINTLPSLMAELKS